MKTTKKSRIKKHEGRLKRQEEKELERLTNYEKEIKEALEGK